MIRPALGWWPAGYSAGSGVQNWLFRLCLAGPGPDQVDRVDAECRKPLLEIMRRFVALPWVRKLGPLAPPACADRWRRGFPAIRRSRPGRKVHSVMVCRRPSPFDLGPFEAGY